MNPFIGFCKLRDTLKAEISQKYNTLNRESAPQKRRYAMVVEYHFSGGVGNKINYVTVASNVREAINKAKEFVIKTTRGIMENSILITDIYSESCEAKNG